MRALFLSTLPAFFKKAVCLMLFCLLCFAAAQAEEECQVIGRPDPKVLVNDQEVLLVVGETTARFPKHYGTYPPSGKKERNGDDDHYYILNEEKPVLYVPNFLNQSIAQELQMLCTSQGRFVHSPIRGHGDGTVVEKDTELRTRYVSSPSILGGC
jgi:hypothetical protein